MFFQVKVPKCRGWVDCSPCAGDSDLLSRKVNGAFRMLTMEMMLMVSMVLRSSCCNENSTTTAFWS